MSALCALGLGAATLFALHLYNTRSRVEPINNIDAKWIGTIYKLDEGHPEPIMTAEATHRDVYPVRTDLGGDIITVGIKQLEEFYENDQVENFYDSVGKWDKDRITTPVQTLYNLPDDPIARALIATSNYFGRK